MNSRKTKNLENNENLCPSSRKRAKISINDTKSKSKTVDSPSTSRNSRKEKPEFSDAVLNEMGIGLLDSEESSSSCGVGGPSSASTMRAPLYATGEGDLTRNNGLTTIGDENANEATPNLDAPKLQHYQQMKMYHGQDRPLDTTVDSIKNESQQISSNNSSFAIYTDDEGAESKKLFESTSFYAAAKAQKIMQRNPLAPVAYNSQENRINDDVIQQMSSTAVDVDINYNMNNQKFMSSFSPSKPCTSRQALYYASHIKQQTITQQTQERVLSTKKIAGATQYKVYPSDSTEFFVFRERDCNPCNCTTETMLNNHNCNNNNNTVAKDYLSLLSDEIILYIFKYLPKTALIRCSTLNQRMNRCAKDESLWARLDLGGRSLRPGALGNIITRGLIVLRLAQTMIKDPIFDEKFLSYEPKYKSKLQFLDLSMSTISKPSLKLLLSHCRSLQKLSLEHVPLNNDICHEIGKNTKLEALNLTMCEGLEAWSIRTLLEPLVKLENLNISWTSLSADAVTAVVSYAHSGLLRLNISGCRKTMFNSHLDLLVKRCNSLLELDLSDCTALTDEAISIICRLPDIEYLSLSRCYLIPAAAFMQLGNLRRLQFFDIFGSLSDTAMQTLASTFPNLHINKFIHSSVARPTVGTRRTSIWGLRTRD